MKQPAHTITDTRAKLLPRITGFFFDRPLFTALIWLVLLVFGILSYTTFLRREGFPSIAIPIVIVNGTYAVNDPSKVDTALGAPVSDAALKQTGVKSVTTNSQGNFFNAVIQYNENVNAAQAKADLQKAIAANNKIPKGVHLTYAAPQFGVTGGSTTKIDATIAVYDTSGKLTSEQLTLQAGRAVTYLNNQQKKYVAKYSVDNPYESVVNPETGTKAVVQKSFDRYIVQNDGKTSYHSSVIIDVASVQGSDVIKLDNEIQKDLQNLHTQPGFAATGTAITASYAPSIKQEISELQRVLLEGLLAVLIVGTIVIAFRASLITVLSMVTVIATTLGMIYLLGYTLNVITLFALILGLSLIVDDTIIMVEAIDSARKHNTDRRAAVHEAAQKIGRAMVAATLTATLSFLPLAFVGGILGSFIRAIPVTIITALLTSLIAALIFIPLFARGLLLGKKQMGEKSIHEFAASFEAKIARGIARPMIWARHHRKREFSVGIIAVLVGLLFIGAGGFIARDVAFNIFPPSKDTDQLSVSMSFPSGTTIDQAEALAGQVDKVTGKVLGDNLQYASYYGMGNPQSATLFVNLKPYGQRGPTAPKLAAQVNDRLISEVPEVTTSTNPVDVGPPAGTFNVNITATNREGAAALSKDMAAYLQTVELKRANGTTAHFKTAVAGNSFVYKRVGGVPILTVLGTFDDSDTTTLTGLAQTAVKDHYTSAKLQQFRLKTSDITFDLGQESDNQSSFKSLLIAFPLVLLAIYILLLIQFRSFLQPLLIFMALPFSFFGIALGLKLTNNPFSFFAMLGFFALIGLSIKNTILLTDYANQARRAGLGPVDATVGALGERFRPLVATSLTAVFSLIPLALTSPFWQGLAVVLIFGLLSSTLLVILVFPYYYLGGEYLRQKVSRGRTKRPA
jgi:multidrug efflux pump subunit AcrB